MNLGAVESLLSGLTALARALATISGVLLLALALLTTIDIAMTVLLRAPILGAQDIAELGLIVIVFLALPYCGRAGGHVAIDILAERLPPGPRRAADALVRLLGFAVFAILAWRSVLAALSAADFEAASNLLTIPHAPFYLVIAVGAGLYAAILFAEMVLVVGRGPRPAGQG